MRAGTLAALQMTFVGVQGRNCYAGRGAGFNLASPNASINSLQQCQHLCGSVPACAAYVVAADFDGQCHLRGRPIMLRSCASDMRFHSYVGASAKTDPCGKLLPNESLPPSARSVSSPRQRCNLSAGDPSWGGNRQIAPRYLSHVLPVGSSTRASRRYRLGQLEAVARKWGERPRTFARILHQSWKSCTLPSRAEVWRSQCEIRALCALEGQCDCLRPS